MLQYVGEVRVGLVGTNVSGDAVSERLTTYPILAFTVNADTQVEGSEEQLVTPTQFEQFVEAVHDDALSAAETASDSEAWAAGTRNGVPVASTDPAYHNNAKYYSEDLVDDVTQLNSDFNALGLSVVDGELCITYTE